jgi:dTDP-4-amino-4,6-dideoxygalactose transaminase
VTPRRAPNAKHIFHLYVVRVKDRDMVKRHLEEKGVGCGLHYPIPVHLLDAYKYLGRPEASYPQTEAAAREILSLPMFPEITEEQQQYVADCLAGATAKA